VLFLDAKNKQGLLAEISSKNAGDKAVTVQLAPCGSAQLRFISANGKPVAGRTPNLQIVTSPGVDPFQREAVLNKGLLFADADFVANLDRLNYWRGLRSDAQGRVRLPALIPGATYRLLPHAKGQPARDFTVEAGKTMDLGDVSVGS